MHIEEVLRLCLNFVSERGNMWFNEPLEEPWSELLDALLNSPSNSLAAHIINGERNVYNIWKNFAHLTRQ